MSPKKPHDLKVLIAEKDAFLSIRIMETLTRLGFNPELIEIALSAAKAKELLKQKQFDVLLIAGDLGDDDGINVVRHIREFNCWLPIIFTGVTPPAELNQFENIQKVPKPDLTTLAFGKAFQFFGIDVKIN